MKKALVLCCAAMLFSCVQATVPRGFAKTAADLPENGSVELIIADSGRFDAVEVHADFESFPQEIRDLFGVRLDAGTVVLEATKIHTNHELTYEVAFEKNGLKHELHMTPDGRFVLEEMQVALADLDQALADTVTAALPGITLTKAEEIRSGQSQLLEYHVKGTVGAKKYKVRLDDMGAIIDVRRELNAELEIPISWARVPPVTPAATETPAEEDADEEAPTTK